MSYALRWIGRLVAALAGSPDGPPAFDPAHAHLYDLAGDPALGSDEPRDERPTRRHRTPRPTERPHRR